MANGIEAAAVDPAGVLAAASALVGDGRSLDPPCSPARIVWRTNRRSRNGSSRCGTSRSMRSIERFLSMRRRWSRRRPGPGRSTSSLPANSRSSRCETASPATVACSCVRAIPTSRSAERGIDPCSPASMRTRPGTDRGDVAVVRAVRTTVRALPRRRPEQVGARRAGRCGPRSRPACCSSSASCSTTPGSATSSPRISGSGPRSRRTSARSGGCPSTRTQTGTKTVRFSEPTFAA